MRPAQTPEGHLVEQATIKNGRSVRQLAANAGISDARWRHIVKGYQPKGGGRYEPVIGPAATLARMAYVLELTPEELATAGRADAAKSLADMQEAHERGQRAEPGDDLPDEIELIYQSDLPASRKLDMIRMVLRLRAQAGAEHGGDEERRTA